MYFTGQTLTIALSSAGAILGLSVIVVLFLVIRYFLRKQCLSNVEDDSLCILEGTGSDAT